METRHELLLKFFNVLFTSFIFKAWVHVLKMSFSFEKEL